MAAPVNPLFGFRSLYELLPCFLCSLFVAGWNASCFVGSVLGYVWHCFTLQNLAQIHQLHHEAAQA
jgi:hypothetical protein